MDDYLKQYREMISLRGLTDHTIKLTIYKDFQLKKVLEQADFHDVKVQKNDKGWTSISARK